MLADGCVVILNEMFVCVAPTNGMQRKHVFDRPCPIDETAVSCFYDALGARLYLRLLPFKLRLHPLMAVANHAVHTTRRRKGALAGNTARANATCALSS